MFYHKAAVVFLGALRPASRIHTYGKDREGKVPPPADPDRDQAKEAAHACAAVLDGGIVPKDFVLPDIAALMGLIVEKEVLDAATAKQPLSYAQGHGVPNPQHGGFAAVFPPTMTEGQRAKSLERISSLGGHIPTRADALAKNEASLRTLADVSEVVRAHALDAAAIRLASRKELTGARTCRHDVIGVVVDALLDAIDAADALGLPTKSADAYTEEQNEAFGMHQFPYPAQLAVGVAVARDEMLAVRTGLIPPPSDEDVPQEP